MLIGLAGVTSTGKTTMANAIKERYGNKVIVQEKISRQEIYEYAHFGNRDNDLRKLSNKERAIFDIARVELQMSREFALYCRTTIGNETTCAIVDGCTIVKLAYLIYLSAPFIVEYFGEGKLTQIIDNGIEHCNKYYSRIFYLPVTRLPFAEADHRLFKNKYIRMGQDAILNRMLSTQLNSNLDITGFNNTDMNLVFDELSKSGVN